jgi:hypothetical protein
MVTRKSLSLLAGITLVLFAIAVSIGTDHTGALDVIGRITWFSFLACALFLVVASIATLARRGARVGRS